MKITVLDGFAANPGDLSWDFLGKYGKYEVFDRTPVSLIPERAKDSEIIVINKTPISRETLKELPRLKFIAVLATGFNVVDTAACDEKGIYVANIPSYSVSAVAQQTFAFILEYANRVGEHTLSVNSGDWTASPDFSYQVSPLCELDGKTLGIIGYGRIGRKVASMAAAFGMKTLIYTAHPDKYPDTACVSLSELLANSDIVSLHCPLTPETDKMVNKEFIAQMKDGAFLVNTSRGQEVDEQALADALNSGKLSGAGVDVLSVEPPKADNPLLTAKNIYVTPHIAWAAKETRGRLLSILEENIAAFVSGTPVNIVNMQ